MPAAGAPAQALEGAASAVNSVAKALKIAKKADKRLKEALRLAQEAVKSPGPRGPQGPAGSDAQFNGAPAGGGLEFYWLYDATTGQPSGLHVTAGNDTGTNHNLTVEVACLAP